MKIKKLRLQGFRNHTDSILEFGDNSFISLRGSNFAGKSSIAQAISMGLTPSTMGLDAAGRGFISKIQRGAQKAVITVDVQGGKHLVQNVVTLNTNTSGRTSRAICLDDPDWHPAPFERLLDANRAALSVILNTDAFLLLDEKSQKSLLAKLALPSSYDFPKDKIDAVEKAIGTDVIDFGGEPFAVIDLAYKKLYKEREAVNRQVKDFVIPEPLGGPNVGSLPAMLLGVDSASLQAKVTAAQEARQKIMDERDADIKKTNDAEVKRTRIQGKIEALETKIREEQDRFSGIEGRILPDAKLKGFQKTAENQRTLSDLEEARQKIAGVIAAKKAEMDVYNDAVNVGSECPTCHQEIDAQKMVALSNAAAAVLLAEQKKDTSILQMMKEMGDIAGAVKAIADHEKAVGDKAAVVAVIAEKAKLLKDAVTELKGLPDASKDTSFDFAKPLADADVKINLLIAELRPVIAAEERQKEISTKTEQLTKLQAKATSIDELVTYFGKDGIKAKLLKDNIGGFEDKLNLVLGAWDYKVSLAIEPDFEFLVTDAKGVTTPVRELSGSESLMFMGALQCAVSSASGIGIVVVDRLDTFLPSQRKKANKVLYELTKSRTLEQVITIVSDESVEVPNLPNAAFFLVQDGTVQRLRKG